MKRPLLPVALVYVVGLLLAEAIQPPLLFLFPLAFASLFLTLGWAQARAFLIWPLLIVVAWVNLVSRTAGVSPNELRKVAGPEPALVTVRAVLRETPSLRVYGQGAGSHSEP